MIESDFPKSNAIVVCCTASFIPYAMVTLLSCLDHGAGGVADFHMIVPDATDQDERNVLDFSASHSLSLNLHRVSTDPSIYQLRLNDLGISTMLRLYLDQHLPHHYDRVLYLDADLLTVGAMTTIFDLDLKGKLIGAVEDVFSLRLGNGRGKWASVYASIGLNPDLKYYNTGVMLFDWRALVSSGRLKKCVDTGIRLNADGVAYMFADQDLINIEFEDDFLPLHPRWNAIPPYVPHLTKPAVFRHFAGYGKPWDEMLNPASLRYARTYRNYLKGSPWQLSARLKWKQHTEWVFRVYLLNMINSGMKRAIRQQLPSE